MIVRKSDRRITLKGDGGIFGTSISRKKLIVGKRFPQEELEYLIDFSAHLKDLKETKYSTAPLSGRQNIALCSKKPPLIT